jgi:hypothetical protein
MRRVGRQLGSAAFAGVVAANGHHRAHLQHDDDEAPSELSGRRLKHVTVFFRHGSRTPVHTDFPGVKDYRWDDCCAEQIEKVIGMRDSRQVSLDGGAAPRSLVDSRQQKVELPGGCVSGALSCVGADQGLRLGKQLRARYAELLELHPDDVHVRSTNVSRCVLTAKAVLGGLLGPSGSDGQSGQKPIPIHSAASSEEDLTPNPRRCARLAELWDEARTAWSADSDALHRRSESTRAALHATMAQEVHESYGVRSGRWVPLKDVLSAVAVLPSAGGGTNPTAAT